MNDQASIPLGGVLRVIYFIALAIALVAFVTSGVTNIYEGPEDEFAEDSGGPLGIFPAGFATNSEQQDYDRNLGIIFSLLGTAVMAFGIVALPRTLNGARTGIFGGGLIVYIVGLADASSGSNDWLVAVWGLVALIVLIAVVSSLDEGGDWGTTTYARLVGRST